MFDKSFTWKRMGGAPEKTLNVNLGHVPYLEPEGPEDRRRVRLAVTVAVLGHLVFFLVQMPELAGKPLRAGAPQKVYVIQQVRFQQPPPPAQQIAKKKERKKKIPIPDPTPDEPEPIVVDEVELPEFEISDIDALVGIPEGPPGPPIAGIGPNGPYRPGGEVTAPIKIVYPSPLYTEQGRQNRVQGVVILEAIIDALGDVASVKVLKGLPDGLTESAVETAKKWKFEPAKRQGQPVAVYLNLTIRFSLQ